MNINGHEIERRDCRVYIDGYNTEHAGNSDPDYYTRRAASLRVEIARRTREADHADLIAEFVRREQAEKAAQDATREIERRARLVAEVWMPKLPWEYMTVDTRYPCLETVRTLDADAADQAMGT
jgi:hypothetical protein